jgi:Recombinase
MPLNWFSRCSGNWVKSRGVLNYFAREGLELPSQRLHRGIGRVITWQKPRYHVIYQILTNPMYAGIYAYGRRQEVIDPLEKTRQVLRREQSEWDAFIPDHHPGYISKQEYEANQRMLENNYNQFPANQGAVREGPTRLARIDLV